MTLRIHEHERVENIGRSVSVYTLSEPFLSVLNPQGVGSLSKLNIQPKYSCAINNKNQSSDWCSEFTGPSSCDLNHQETCSSTEIEYCHRNDITKSRLFALKAKVEDLSVKWNLRRLISIKFRFNVVVDCWWFWSFLWTRILNSTFNNYFHVWRLSWIFQEGLKPHN